MVKNYRTIQTSHSEGTLSRETVANAVLSLREKNLKKRAVKRKPIAAKTEKIKISLYER